MITIKALFHKYYDIISYLFFGALTTLANYLVYFPCHNWLHLSATVSNVVAWAAAVIFAYLTNKPFVFHSYDWSMKTVLPEFGKFLSCRIASGVLETLIIFVSVDCLHWNGNVMKIITSVLVVVINYVASKLLIFRKRNNTK